MRRRDLKTENIADFLNEHPLGEKNSLVLFHFHCILMLNDEVTQAT